MIIAICSHILLCSINNWNIEFDSIFSLLYPHHSSEYISMKSIPNGAAWVGALRRSSWAAGQPEDKGKKKHPSLSSCGPAGEKGVPCGMCNHEAMKSMKICSQTLGKNTFFWNVLNIFLLIYQEALGKGCPEGEERHFLTLCGLPLYFAMLDIHFCA